MDSQILVSGYNRLKLWRIKINRTSRINKIKENKDQGERKVRMEWMLIVVNGVGG